ncbi:bestrophin family protein [Chromobacterium subtsugae]|uniref:bestrophin family protein n=1 Tax=Chromobacterium subtsugae TaxID=251747 RepID=UPI000640EADE|nr:bestrophin family ion channel [Chromobacterium subtsugae]
MIVRSESSWLKLLFVWEGSVIRRIIPQLLFMAGISGVALLTDGHVFGDKIPLNTVPFTLVGVALTIFLAFRNNASYDRYWEARKLWGHFLIAIRSLASMVISIRSAQPAMAAEGEAIIRKLLLLPSLLKSQLRGDALENASCAGKAYKPTVLCHEIRSALYALNRQGLVTDMQLLACDGQMGEIFNVIGGCERIKSTPIPFVYSVLLHRTVYIYCLFLPFGLVDIISYATPFITVFLSYTLFALESIASELAEPFSCSPNGLPLDAMTRTIERTVLELNDEALPSDWRVGSHYILT